MIPLVIVRPAPGAAATVAAAAAQGLVASAHPIFAVRPLPWASVPRANIDAVILGSANAVRHGGAALEEFVGVPAYCVGQTTAIAAASRGLQVVQTGRGGLQQVLGSLAAQHCRLLRLAGTSRVPLALPDGVTMETREVYATDPLPMGEMLERVLRTPAVVMLHSGEAADHFAAICAQARIDRLCIRLATIGPRVAAMAGAGWQAVGTAARPSDAALLALAREMCQD